MTTAGPIDYGKSRWRAALSFSPYPLLVLAPFAWLIANFQDIAGDSEHPVRLPSEHDYLQLSVPEPDAH